MNTVNRARQLLLKHVDLARQRAARGRATDELGACANLTALSGQVSEGG
jgi:hypothetical protein